MKAIVPGLAGAVVDIPGAEAWLSSLLTARMPAPGRMTLTAMLNDAGRIVGEFTVARTGPEEFHLFGSLAAEIHHSRWFLHHLPADGSVRFFTNSTSVALWRGMGTAAGGEVLPNQ